MLVLFGFTQSSETGCGCFAPPYSVSDLFVTGDVFLLLEMFLMVKVHLCCNNPVPG